MEERKAFVTFVTHNKELAQCHAITVLHSLCFRHSQSMIKTLSVYECMGNE